jgi:hypothetical protein
MGCNCGRKTLAPAPPPMSQMPQANSRLTVATQPAAQPVNPGNGRVGVGGVITPQPGEAYLGLTPKP